MKLLKIFVAAILALAAALTGGCSDDDGIDNRDLDYGYVQFKLYKEASYDAVSRAQKPQLDYLYEAAKVQVSLGCNGTTVTQTLTLSASDKESAEFGLRSEKLRLLTGQYQIITFSLYDANDELIYNGMPLDDRLVEAGGLQVHDLTVDVEPRGKVRFTIRKDLSDFTETPVTRAADRQYTFDEIAFISLTVKQGETNEQTTFKMLPTKFSIHFDEDDDTFGYQTSSLECDTLLSLKAGSYKMMRYETYDKNKLLLETNKVMNLTAITDPADVATLHFLDCAALLTLADFHGKTVVDVGTGAGFPGMPLRLVEPTIRLTLLDSLGKRIHFLQTVCDELGLTDVACIHGRAEEFAAEHRGSYDLAVSRAVASLPVLAELSLPLVKVGGSFLAMKSVDSDQELAAAETALRTLGGETAQVRDYAIPGTDVRHRLVLVKKIRETPKKYPRLFAKIKKNPL